MISAPVAAPISIPLWLLEAPSVGDSLSPKLEVMRLLDGQGHLKLIFPKFDTVYVLPAASAFFLASSSLRFISASIFFIWSSWALMSALYWSISDWADAILEL